MLWRKSHQKTELETVAGLKRLSGLSDKEIQHLVARGARMTAPAGSTLTEEGAKPDGAYLIIDGEVTVQRGGQEVARLGPGEFVGEIALLNWSASRTATVVAATDLDVLRYSNEEVELLAVELPHFKRAMNDAAYTRLDGDLS
jgi:CRP/FNR family transcriptional regulator, cyclic AMP receptor protein